MTTKSVSSESKISHFFHAIWNCKWEIFVIIVIVLIVLTAFGVFNLATMIDKLGIIKKS